MAKTLVIKGANFSANKVDTVELFARFYEEQLGKPLDDVQEGIVAGVVREVENDYASGGEGAAR